MSDTQGNPARGAGTQDPAQRLLESERISIKAVLVEAGEDPMPLLREAGITEILSLPVALDADSGTASALADGWGSSITATWEPDQDEEADFPTDADPQDTASDDSASHADPATPSRAINLPAAFGMRPMAPIDRSS